MAKKNTKVSNDNSIIGNWVESNAKTLAEVQTVNPELYSAVGSVLNYLNTYFGGQSGINLELFKTKIPENSIWRVKTEKEFIDERGLNWRYKINWTEDSSMDWLFGKYLTEVVDDNYVPIPIDLPADLKGKELITRKELDPQVMSWALSEETITNKPLPTIETLEKSVTSAIDTENWRVMTEQELIEEFGKYWRDSSPFVKSGNMDYLFGQPITEFREENVEEFLRDTSNGAVSQIEKKLGWIIESRYFINKPLPSKALSPNPTLKIYIVDVLKNTKWSDGLKMSMYKDFEASGMDEISSLVSTDKQNTSRNIQAQIKGFSSGKNTYLQANMLAEIIHEILEEKNRLANQTNSGVLPIVDEVFDVNRQEGYKFEAQSPDESYAFQNYLFSKGIVRAKFNNQIPDEFDEYFLVVDGVLVTLSSSRDYSQTTVEEITFDDLGITVDEYRKPRAIKKTKVSRIADRDEVKRTRNESRIARRSDRKAKRQEFRANQQEASKPPIQKDEVNNLYNELDDLDI